MHSNLPNFYCFLVVVLCLGELIILFLVKADLGICYLIYQRSLVCNSHYHI